MPVKSWCEARAVSLVDWYWHNRRPYLTMGYNVHTHTTSGLYGVRDYTELRTLYYIVRSNTSTPFMTRYELYMH